MQLVLLTLSYLLANELVIAGRRIAGIGLEVLAGIEHLTTIARNMLKEAEALEGIYNRLRGSAFTAMFADQDAIRDALYRAFYGYLTSWSFRVDKPDQQAAALSVLAILNPIGTKFLKYGNARETVKLNAIFKDLEPAEIVARMNQVGAVEWLDAVKTAQNAFERIYHDKVATVGQAENLDFRNAMNALATSLNAFLTSLDYASIHNPTEPVNSAISQVNVVIDDIMAVVRARRTRDENAASAGNPPPPATT
jgi:hypothetical protein